MDLAYLADHPELVPVLAAWHHAEWRDFIPEWSLAEATRELAGHTARAAIPTTLLALEGPELVGSASLLLEDLPEWRPRSPWVASVFVAPAWRGRGVGTRLVERAVALAGELGVAELFLLTEDRAEFYRRLGWSVVEVSRARGAPVTIMSIRPRR